VWHGDDFAGLARGAMNDRREIEMRMPEVIRTITVPLFLLA
jgi:hypothetical protein